MERSVLVGVVECWLFKGGEVMSAGGESGCNVVRPSEVRRRVVWQLVLSACGRGFVCVWVLWFGRQPHWS